MLIWSGGGILVPLIGIVVVGAGIVVGGATLGFGLGLLAAGGVIWIAGTRLNDKPDQHLIDPETEELVRLRRRNAHTFFFVPMQWWGPVAAVLGLVTLVGGLLSTLSSDSVARRGAHEGNTECTHNLGVLTLQTYTRQGEWDGSCRSEHYRDGEYARYFRFELDRVTLVTLDLTSPSVDTWLALRSEAAGFLEENDDGGDGTDARIEGVFLPGTYTIEATTLVGGETGPFTLDVMLAPPTSGESANPRE